MENLIHRIASFADIDTRRAMGIYNRLPKSNLVPYPIPPTTFRYFPAEKKILYLNFDQSYDVYSWEVYTDIEPYGDAWVQSRHGKHRGVWHGLDDFVYFDKQACHYLIHFAGIPETV
jgi:hypothetical protein